MKRRGDVFDFLLECVECGERFYFSYENMKERHLNVTCPHCGGSFHIFDLFDYYHVNEPIVQKCVDISVKHANTPFTIRTKDPEAQQILEDFSKSVDLAKLFGKAFYDLVMYGDVFVEISDQEDISLILLDPRTVEVVTTFREDMLSPQVDHYVQTVDDRTRSIQSTQMVHAKTDLRYEKYGWAPIIRALNYIRYLREAHALSVPAWWITYLENHIMLSFQIPRMVVFKDSSSPVKVAEVIAQHYIYHISNLQRKLGQAFERSLFRDIATSHGFDEYPNIEWQRLTIRDVLVDSGYGADVFAKDVESFRELHKLGIITEEELKQILAKYGVS